MNKLSIIASHYLIIIQIIRNTKTSYENNKINNRNNDVFSPVFKSINIFKNPFCDAVIYIYIYHYINIIC